MPRTENGNGKNSENPHVETAKQNYNKYQLSVSIGLVRMFVLIFASFNLLLIAVDYINIPERLRLSAVILRGVFILSSVLLIVFISKIKTFRVMALFVTIFELAAVMVYFHVFFMYGTPDFTIQLLGLMIIIIAVFLVPNVWANMISITVGITAAFFICVRIFTNVEDMLFYSAAVYTMLEIALCAVFSFNFNRYKRGEFLARVELKRVYETDHLTGIGNRAKLEEEAQKWLMHCEVKDERLSLVLVDVDELKHINDKFGHLAGDAILCEIARIMHTQLRKNDVCVRWGGDEFVLLLPFTNADDAGALMQRIRTAISDYEFYPDYRVSCSFGISEFKRGGKFEELLREADISMYEEKKQSKFKGMTDSAIPNI